jgi:hypothetical protein
MNRKRKPMEEIPVAGTAEIPPGATSAAADRPINRKRGAPGSGAGPRHAANDPGTPDESYGAVDSNDPLAEREPDDPQQFEEGPPYSGKSGGALGGSPAGLRSSEAGSDRPIYDKSPPRGDSTIGSKKRKR